MRTVVAILDRSEQAHLSVLLPSLPCPVSCSGERVAEWTPLPTLYPSNPGAQAAVLPCPPPPSFPAQKKDPPS